MPLLTVQQFLSAWFRFRRLQRHVPRVGEEAPGFALRSPDGQRLVRLSDFRGVAPVALVFGSFT